VPISDSTASAVSHAWVWEQGGGVFGVRLTNYLGWWLVTDLGGQVWSVHALNETMLTFNIFSTVVIAGLAAVKLLRNDIALRQR
jgi:hypothetical protein